MLSGRRLDLIDPSPVDIEIEDIAHGLSRVARWNGQTTGEEAVSVAQHSLIVEELLVHATPGIAARWRLAALLHDAAEYVIGDMISPFKAALGLNYQDFEDRLTHAIHIRFGLPAVIPAEIKTLIKAADRSCAYFEATQLAGFSPDEARNILRNAPGCLVIDSHEPGGYVTPYEAAGEDATYISRIREDATVENGLAMWIVSDNLRKGAALNAIQIAECLINRKLITAKRKAA